MSEVTVKLAAFTPLNVTAVAPVRLVPLIVTVVPTTPLVGVKLVIAGITLKLAAHHVPIAMEIQQHVGL